MKTIIGLLLLTNLAYAGELRKIAVKHGYAPKQQALNAIRVAAKVYNLNAKELLAIALVETGAKQSVVHKNLNGTLDVGLFQINTVNWGACSEFNIWQVEGNALCAAKLLASLKHRFPKTYLERYHSHTISKRNIYAKRLEKFLEVGQNKH